MLQNRVNINKIILNNNSVLNLICDFFNKNYRIILIDTLLQKKIDINILNCKNQTALIYNQLDSIKIYELVAWKTDFGTVDTFEHSTLYIAVVANNFYIIEAFLVCYIDTLIQDKKNKTTRFYLNKTNSSTDINSRIQILQLFDK